MSNNALSAWLNKYSPKTANDNLGSSLPTSIPPAANEATVSLPSSVSSDQALQNWVNKYQVSSPKPSPAIQTPSVNAADGDDGSGKTFLQKLGDILSFNQNMEQASNAMMFGAMFGNKELENIGKQLAETTGQKTVDSSKEFGYIAERGAGGAAKGAEGFINALGYMGQMLNRNQLQQNAQDIAMWGAVTGNENFNDAAQHLNNYAEWLKDEGLQNTVKFGSKYQEDIQNRYKDADITKTGQMVGGVSEAIGGMIPSIAANAAIPGSGLVVTVLSAGGNAAQEAKANGASDYEALLYGTAVGGIEAATEKIFDGVAGVFGKGAADDIIEGIAKKLGKSQTAQNAFVKIANGLGEGFEEFISEFGQRVANELIIDTDNRSFLETLGDAGTSAIMGAVVGGVIQASNSIVQGIKADPATLAQQAASAAVGQINTQTTENPENQPTTPANDAAPTTAPSEQKTAPNAVNGAEAEVNVFPGPTAITEKNREDNTLAYNLATNLGAISDMSPVSTLTGREMNDKTKKPSEQIADFFKSLGNKVFRSGFGDVSLGEYGVGGMINHRPLNRAKMVSLSAVPDVIKLGRQIGYDPNWKGRGYASYIFAAPVTVSGQTVYVAAVVDQRPDNKFYLSEMVDSNGNYVRIEESPSGNSKNGVTDGAVTSGDGLTARPEGLSVGATPSATKNGTDPAAPSFATTVSQSEPVVKSGDTESVGAAPSVFGQNTVGSAQARFKYQEAPTQSVADNLFTEQEMQDYDLRNKHQVYTDAEANALADQLLAQDYEGEVSRLRDPDEVWDKTANVEGHRVLENLIAKARESGNEADWDAVREWKALYDRKGGTEHAQALQGRKQFANSTAEIVAEAAETLEGPDVRKLKPQKKAQLLDEVYTQAEMYNGIEEGDLNSLISLIERNNEIRRTTGLFSKKTAKQMDWALHQVAEKYPDTAEQFLRNVAVAQIRNIASDYNKVGVTEAAKSVRIMNMLSKISTVMRNLVSNNIFDPLEAISGDVGVIADLIMSKMTGQRTTTIDRSWISKAKRAGTLEGALKSYIEVGLDAPAQDATSRYEGSGSGRTFKMTGNVLERFLSTWSKYENYALQTTDEAQKGGIRAETQRQIDSLKASGKLSDDALNEWADETARQRTFQNDSKLAKAATGLRDAANNFHIGSIGAGDILLPFARVPANLVSQSANYSPLGLLRSVVEVAVDAKRGTVDPQKQAQVARNFGRGVTGTALLAGFAALAAKGLIDVAGADDEDKEALEKAQGKTGTQWNLSATLRALNGGDMTWKDDDLLMSIGFLDPLNSIMAAGSLLADDYAEKGELTISGIGEATIGSLWQSLMDLPAVTSLNDIINAYKYSDAETMGGKVWDTIVDYGGSQLASFVIPNVLRGVATGFDNTVRNQYSGETAQKTTLDSIKSGVPGLRETLPASLDPFGREKTQTGNTLLNFLNNNILPGSFTKYSETTVEKVLEDLYSVTGEASIYPDRKAPNSFSVDKEKITLDADDKDQFMKVAGSTAENLMSDLVKSKTFTSATKEEQAAYLKLANEYARAMAKYDLTNGKYELSGFAKSAEKAVDAGIDLSDYLMYYSGKPEYNTDGNSTYSNAENLKAVEESGFTGDALTALYMITFPSWVESAAKKDVDFERYLEYKKITNGASKKADKIRALIAAGYNAVQANRMYNELD